MQVEKVRNLGGEARELRQALRRESEPLMHDRYRVHPPHPMNTDQLRIGLEAEDRRLPLARRAARQREQPRRGVQERAVLPMQAKILEEIDEVVLGAAPGDDG